MPSGICKCGKLTNSATSNWWFTKGQPTKCFLAWELDGTLPQRGCGYKDCDPWMKKYVDDCIKNDAWSHNISGGPNSPAMGRKEATMEELQKALVAKVDEQLKADKPNIQYLDVLNRLLGTVSNWLVAKGQG